MPSTRVWRSPFPELALVALVILIYGDTLAYGYIWDDRMLVQLGLRDALERSFDGLHVRPVWYLSYVLTQRLEASAVFEHGVNLALFALATVLAHRLALAMLESRAAASMVTLVWVLLPWNAYPVTWISQRNDLLLFVFGFTAVLAMRRGRYVLAWFCLALAMFSKVTLIAVPLYFIWRARRSGHRLAAVAFSALFVAYLALALRGYLLYLEPAAHLEQVGWLLRLLRFPLHWLEHLVLLAVPVPFFLSILHVLVYLGGFAGLLFSTTRRRPREDGRHDIWLLAVLASLAAAVTPELRICGFESLFWLLAVAQHRRLRAPLPAAIALAAVLAAFGAGIVATKAIFDTRQPVSVGNPSLYPNDYYRQRRAVLTGLSKIESGDLPLKAVYIERYGPSEVLTYGDRPRPVPKPDEILIEVHAAGVNPRDWLIRSGRYQFRWLLPRFPLILGSDVAGVVVEVGEQVVRFEPGDKVYAMVPSSRGFGGYAEYAAVPDPAATWIPESMSFEEAAGVPLAGLTAYQALARNANMGPGERVLVIGASGGVGHYAVQIALGFAAQVTGVCSNANIEMVRRLGAMRVIDYKQEHFSDVARGFDVVFDTIGRESLRTCAPVLKPGGTYVTTIPGVGTMLAMARSRLAGRFSRQALRSEVVLVEADGTDLEAMTILAEAGELSTIVDSVYPLEEAAKAHDRSRTFRTRGKLILKVR